MKNSLTLILLSILACGVLAGCGSTSSPSSDDQMDRYKENEEKAKKLGGNAAAGQTAEQTN